MAKKAGRSDKDAPEESASRGSPLWTKPIAWFGGLVVVALGFALSDVWLIPMFSTATNVVLQRGDPVIVLVEETENPFGGIAFPTSVRLSGTFLAELSGLSVEDQRARLKGLGGVSEGEYLTLTVTGNRADGVRIMDIRPIADCSEQGTGTLVYTEQDGGRGDLVESIEMYLTVDEPRPAPYYIDDDGSESLFFPARTITLEQDEEVVIIIYAGVERVLCGFDLEMTVREGSETQQITITNNDNRFVRIPSMEDQVFRHVYLGGYICKNYVEALGSWWNEPTPGCIENWGAERP